MRWRVHPRWYAIAIGLPVLTMTAGSIVFAILGLPLDPSLLPGRLASFLPMLLYFAVLEGGNEEPGWRGFALPRLEVGRSPVAASLVLGVVWAFWHLPVLFANPEATQHGMSSVVALMPVVLVTAANIVALTFVYTWVYNSTGSVLLCILLHASGNATNAFLILLPEAALQGDVYQTVLLVTTIINIIVAAVLIAVTRGRLGYVSSQERNPDAPAAARRA